MNKNRLLKLLNIFIKYTDEEHFLSMQDIITLLEQEDIFVSRKAVYDDIKVLRENGYDIEIIKGKQMKYHLLNHTFDLIEAKLIYDSINSINFLSSKTTQSLSNKLLDTMSIYQKELIINSSLKTNSKYNNDKTLYILSDLQNAIINAYLVSFNYFDITLDKQKKYRYNKKQYELLPYALVLIQQRYYCIFYSLQHKSFSNYRVDKIDNLTIKNESLEKMPFNLEEYLSKSFKMFAGKPENITIQFQNELLNVVLDEFGLDLLIIDKSDTHFTINITTTITDNFLSWISQFKNKAKIIAPISIIERYKQHLKDILNTYF